MKNAHQTTDQQEIEILPPEANGLAIYEPFRARLEELKEREKGMTFDYESPEGAKAARAHIKDFKESLKALEKTRYEEGEEVRKIKQQIDGQALIIKRTIEGFMQVHQSALDEIEKRETLRVQNCRIKIDHYKTVGLGCTESEQIAMWLEEVKADVIDREEFREFTAEAEDARTACINRLEDALKVAIQREKDKEELDRLRQEKEERDENERIEQERKNKEDERIRQEGIAKEKAQEEQAARIGTIRTRISRIADAGCTQTATKELRDTLERLQALVVDEGFGEFQAEATDAKGQAIARVLKQIDTATVHEQTQATLAALEANSKAIEEANTRQAEKDKAERIAQEKRDNDLAHRADVMGKISDDLRRFTGDVDAINQIVDALVAGKIYNTTVRF